MIIHFRPIFLSFIFLAFGIFCFSRYMLGDSWLLILPCTLFITYFLVFGLSKLLNEKFFLTVKKGLSYCVVGIFAFGAGVGLFALTQANYKLEFVPLPSANYEVRGTVDGGVQHNDNANYFFLKDVVVVEEGKEIYIERNIRVYVYKSYETNIDLNDIMSGDKISVWGNIRSTPVFKESGINSYAYKNNFQHTIYPDPISFELTKSSGNVFDNVKNSVYNLYEENLDSPYSGFAYSVFSGDRSDLDKSVLRDFSTIGIAHIVAISGLHVGFLVVLLMWFMKKMRFNKWTKLIVITISLSLYTIFCGASPSVVRASIMAIFLLLGNLLGKQTDNLNSVSLAGIIILLFSPLYIFDLGFLLSFAGVFGIFFLYPVFKDAFSFLKFKWLIEGTALTLAADIATIPIIANAFGYVSLISLIANLFLVPFFGFIFMAMFVLTIVVLILPFLKFMFYIINIAILCLVKVAGFLAGLPFASFTFSGFGAGALISYYSGMFVSSRYVVVEYKYKLALITICYVAFCGFLVAMLI